MYLKEFGEKVGLTQKQLAEKNRIDSSYNRKI